MKIRELIEALQSCDPDKAVYLDNEDGDVEVDIVEGVENGVRLNSKSLLISKVLCSPEGRTALSMEMHKAIGARPLLLESLRLSPALRRLSPEDRARLDASLAEAAKDRPNVCKAAGATSRERK
jgi:hypothetical protein